MNRTLIAPLVAVLMMTGAYAQGQFHPEDVERLRAAALSANAAGKYDCLEMLNHNMRKLYNDPGLRLGSTVDLTMAALQRKGLAGPTQTFDFLDENGRRTTGVTRPKTLRRSVWDGLLASADGVRGWTVFGLSPLDGNHSVTLALDTSGDTPTVFWSDQWGTKKGWKEYPTKEALDGEIERLTHSWWAEKLSELKIRFKSRCRVYPLIPLRTPNPNTATMNRVSHLRMRAGPPKADGTLAEHLRDAEGNKRYFRLHETFTIVEREGKWVKLRLPDGSEAWGHENYMALTYIAPIREEVVVTASEPEVEEEPERHGGALGGMRR